MHKLKELKKYNLLQVKEKLKRQKSINELSQIQSDEEKCQTINRELDRLLSENHALIEEIGVQSFVSNRRLMQKMFDQKEVISNCLEFLDNEKLPVLAEVKKSNPRDEIVERKKNKVKRQVLETLLKKQDENLGVTRRGQ